MSSYKEKNIRRYSIYGGFTYIAPFSGSNKILKNISRICLIFFVAMKLKGYLFYRWGDNENKCYALNLLLTRFV